MSEEQNNKPVDPFEINPTSQTYVVIDGKQAVLPGERAQIVVDAVVAEKLKNGDSVFIAASNDDEGKDLREIGVIAAVEGMAARPDGSVILVLDVRSRGKIVDSNPDAQTVTAETILPSLEENAEVSAFANALFQQFEEFASKSAADPREAKMMVWQLSAVLMQAPAALAQNIVPMLELTDSDKREFLEAVDPVEQIKLAMKHLVNAALTNKVRQTTQATMGKEQREYFLRRMQEQISKELGEDDKAEIDALEKNVKEAGMTKEAEDVCMIEIRRIRKLGATSQEAGVSRTYVERLVALPWAKLAPLNCDLATAEAILDADHYGMEKAKERIIEFLASQKTATEAKGGILCLVGPPGVGKTSIGKSVAKATGREFVHLALGGVNDEAALRGHRRTYIGAVPGNIITELAKIKTRNPLIMLDEVDKMAQGGSAKGADPTAALLELLDPEQNGKFRDHYIGVPYDLSQAMFMVTANYLQNIPPAVRDRMEIIQLPAYTEEEKLQIAKKHLVRKAMAEGGVTPDQFNITDEALAKVISDYTSEAGVRKLFQRIKALARKANVKIQKGQETFVELTADNLQDYAGIPRPKSEKIYDKDQVGVVNGLYYSDAGGGILPIQVVKQEAKAGGFSMTGQLKDVMKESFTVAYNMVRAQARDNGIDPASFETDLLQLHVPAGATPKDGPSAGLAFVTSIVSAKTGIAIRRDVGMTGEVDLLGNALAIGGVNEKLAGALAAGCTKVLVPEANRKDTHELPQKVKDAIAKGALELVFVKDYTEVLQHALTAMPKPLVATAEFENNAGQKVQASSFVRKLLTAMETELQESFQKAAQPAATLEARKAFLEVAAQMEEQAKGLSGSFKVAGGKGFAFAVTAPDGFTPLSLSRVVKKIEDGIPANDSKPMPVSAQAHSR